MEWCRGRANLAKCSRATGEPPQARGGSELEAVEGVGRVAVEADGGGVHVDGVSQDMSGQGIKATACSVSCENRWVLERV